MARAALGWTTRQVAAAAELPVATLNNYEAGAKVSFHIMSTIQSTFEGAGIVFLDDEGGGAGVRFAEADAASDHPKPAGPATDAIERMEAEIAADRGKRKG